MPVEVLGGFQCQARSWRHPRRVVRRGPHTLIGPDERFLVTNSQRPHGARGRVSCWTRVRREPDQGLPLHELRRRATNSPGTMRLDTMQPRLLRVAGRVKKSARHLRVDPGESCVSRDDWLRLARAVGATVTCPARPLVLMPWAELHRVGRAGLFLQTSPGMNPGERWR